MDATLAADDRPTALSAFRSRDFRLLWGGQTISFAGDAAFLVALGWRVTSLTGSAGSLGFVLSLNAAAMLTTLLWGGVLADRHSRRLLMIGSDLARAVLVGVLAVVDGTEHLSLGSIMVLAAAIGFADGFFQPAFGGIVPLVVDQPVLASANSMLSVARQGSLVLGPAIAAGLYGTTGSTAVSINDVTIRNGNSTGSTAGGGVRVDVAAAVATFTNCVPRNEFVTRIPSPRWRCSLRSN